VGFNNSSLGDNAWIRSPNGTTSDLNDLMFGGRSGWHLRSAWAINDKGQIVGEGTLNGVPRMFLLDPVRLPGELVAEMAIDPLALLVSDTVYAQLKLPDPPPFDLVRDRVRQFFGSLQSDQKRSIQERVRAYRQFLQALERELTDG
jgi:hypothetical protein